MRPFMEQLARNCTKFAGRLAFALDYREETVTYGELWELSGKVYAYLKANNVATEDFVLLNLPRGPKVVVAMLGVWRAGAAVTITEAGYPAERVEYIRKDCKAKIVIDEKVYEEMMACEAREGWEKTDPHDACFAVYTSGTTGNPKGALHEYGKIEMVIDSYHVEPDFAYDGNYRFATLFPLNFVACFMWFLPHLYYGNSLYILSYELVKDIRAFSRFVAEEKISEFFLSPSLLKLYKDAPDTLRLICTGSDSVSESYFPHVKLRNCYAMSETGFFVSSFSIDRSYHRTPVGKNACGWEIKILDEEGKPVKDGEQAEVCFDNPYFRGYINLPEQTEKVFRGGIFHTGDMGYKDAEGNLVICGRSDDMIKIHGNRVEPQEIEIAAKEILGVNNIIAKGFSNEGGAFVALYGLAEEIGDGFAEENIPALREKLAARLPQYMIPTCYETLAKFPTNANGKVSRKLFPAPQVKIQQIEYVPPVNEKERILCGLMGEILGINQYGRNLDFYQMGGDSLRTIRLVALAGERGWALKAADIYAARTPQQLAELLGGMKILTDAELQEAEQLARQKPQPLLPMQRLWAALEEANPQANMENIVVFYKLKPCMEPDRLKAALDKVLRHYPIFATRFVKGVDGQLRQVYDEAVIPATEIIEAKEAEMEKLQVTPLEKLDMFAGGCRVKIYQTEENCYLLLHAHHAYMDGGGLALFRDSLYECYEDMSYEPAPDYYYYLLQQAEQGRAGDAYRVAEVYYEGLDMDKGACRLQPDLQGEGRSLMFYRQPDAFPRDEKRTNVFYLTAAALAMAKANGRDRALVYSTYSGRDEQLKMNSAGGFAFNVPVYLVMEEGDTPGSLMKKAAEQFDFGAVHAPYSHFPEEAAEMNDTVQFLYQKDVFSLGKLGKYIDCELNHLPSGEQPWPFFVASVVDDAEEEMLRLCVICSPERFSEAKVEKFQQLYLEAVAYLSEG